MEWWSYKANIGNTVKQVHIDRNGLIQKKSDPTPKEIVLGRWEDPVCETNLFLPIKNNSNTCPVDLTITRRNRYYNLECFTVDEKSLISFKFTPERLDTQKVAFQFNSQVGSLFELELQIDQNLYLSLKHLPSGSTRVRETYMYESLETNPVQFWVLVFKSHFFVGTGTILGKNLKLRHIEPDILKLRKFSLSSSSVLSDVWVSSLPQIHTKTAELMSSIDIPTKLVTLTEFLEEGEQCEDSTPRKTLVDYICSKETKFIELDEFSPCNYRAVMSTPYICPANYTKPGASFVFSSIINHRSYIKNA